MSEEITRPDTKADPYPVTTQSTKSTRLTGLIAAFGIVSFVLGRHFLMPWLDTISPYALYLFDVLYSAIAIYFFSEGRFRLSFAVTKLQLATAVISLVLGAITFRFATLQGIQIPFDLEDPMILFALLILAPILEELLFRQALWCSFEKIARSNSMRLWLPLIGTSILFALAHYEAIGFAPPEYRAFIQYQTGYAFAIALWWGRVYQRQGSVGLTMLLHFCFNFGFYLGSLL